jgi:hypothetical protein
MRPVYGKTKQGASFGHAKIVGKNILRWVCFPSR